MSIVHLYVEFAKQNPAIAASFSIWALGVSSYLLKSLPGNLYRIIKEQSCTEFYIDDGGRDRNKGQFYEKFAEFVNDLAPKNRSRDVTVGNFISLDPINGYGKYVCIYQRRLLWVHREKLDAKSDSSPTESIRIRILSRNKRIIEDILQKAKAKISAERVAKIKVMEDYGGWEFLANLSDRPLSSLIYSDQVKENLLDRIKNWQDRKDWFKTQGIDHKLCIVLEGPPGTGKSSLVKAIAAYLKRDIYVISDAKNTSDSNWSKRVSAAQGHIALIEDFDSISAVTNKKEGENSGISLSGFLNAINGSTQLDDTIIFMTANFIEDINPAVLRSGRTDHIYHVGLLGDQQIKEYINLRTERPYTGSDDFKDITGADLQELYFQNMNNPEQFIDSIPKKDRK